MSFYVRATVIGRYDYLQLAAWLEQSGIGEAEYFDGGWTDYHVEPVASHIKFELEEDAVAYVLTHGGSYSTKVPLKERLNVIP